MPKIVGEIKNEAVSVEHKKLQQATPDELLKAMVQHYERSDDQYDFIAGLKVGFALTQPDGWRHVAPSWLRDITLEGDEDA